MPYAYCTSCGEPRDQVTLEDLCHADYEGVTHDCGHALNVKESEKWSAVKAYIDAITGVKR